jgi:hypothetical protein
LKRRRGRQGRGGGPGTAPRGGANEVERAGAGFGDVEWHGRGGSGPLRQQWVAHTLQARCEQGRMAGRERCGRGWLTGGTGR